ncbi:MAG: hypothetical protein HN348_26970, partial [Proteobacteria bacterium]|nr:hypothetical protein [Pseudomonadota bacterium]
MTRITTILLASLLVGGCTFDEGLIIENLTGTIVLEREAATRVFIDDEGNDYEITDPRLIGPVYLGLYSGVEEGLEAYPHPSQGPLFVADQPGDAYPYGGTTVGDIRYACFEALTCKIASGRFLDFNSIVDWFADTIGSPIQDSLGNDVTTGEYIRQACFESLKVTSDDEVRLTATDTNEDGVVDLKDLDFVEGSDGKFRAEFTIWQQEYFEQADAEEG